MKKCFLAMIMMYSVGMIGSQSAQPTFEYTLTRTQQPKVDHYPLGSIHYLITLLKHNPSGSILHRSLPFMIISNHNEILHAQSGEKIDTLVLASTDSTCANSPLELIHIKAVKKFFNEEPGKPTTNKFNQTIINFNAADIQDEIA